MIVDLGMLLNLRGTPRDPGLIADAASIMMYGRGGLAGPFEQAESINRAIAIVQAWALCTISCAPVSCYLVQRLTKVARILEKEWEGLQHFHLEE